jgi:NAD(P)-dependent dehydrogenase (short-subunit alcohol dehydrogenase family)
VKYAIAPIVYLIGRNETQAARIIEDLEALNPESRVTFVQCDVSLLRRVDEACRAIQEKEEKVNVLVLSSGIFTTKGRDGMFMICVYF